MKNLIVFVAVVIFAFVALGLIFGWIGYQQSTDRTTIDIHTQEMKEDVEEAADKAVHAGRRLVEETEDALEKADERISDE